MKKNNTKQTQGFILIITVIIVSAIISVILISISLSSITRLESNSVSLQGTRAKILAESCAEEALIQLNRNNSYLGASFTLGTGSCTVGVEDSGANKILSISGAIENYTHSLNIEASLSPFQIVQWDN